MKTNTDGTTSLCLIPMTALPLPVALLLMLCLKKGS